MLGPLCWGVVVDVDGVVCCVCDFVIYLLSTFFFVWQGSSLPLPVQVVWVVWCCALAGEGRHRYKKKKLWQHYRGNYITPTIYQKKKKTIRHQPFCKKMQEKKRQSVETTRLRTSVTTAITELCCDHLDRWLKLPVLRLAPEARFVTHALHECKGFMTYLLKVIDKDTNRYSPAFGRCVVSSSARRASCPGAQGRAKTEHSTGLHT